MIIAKAAAALALVVSVNKANDIGTDERSHVGVHDRQRASQS